MTARTTPDWACHHPGCTALIAVCAPSATEPGYVEHGPAMADARTAFHDAHTDASGERAMYIEEWEEWWASRPHLRRYFTQEELDSDPGLAQRFYAELHAQEG